MKTDYKTLRRHYYKKDILLMDMSLFMKTNGITFHNGPGLLNSKSTAEVMSIRVIGRGNATSAISYDPTDVEPKDMLVNRGPVEKHALDETCVILPSLNEYLGAYRFVGNDGTTTVVGRRSGYFRCKNKRDAVVLSLWLRMPMVTEAIRTELLRDGRSNSLSKKFMSDIPIPEQSLSETVVGKALKIDEDIHNTLLELRYLLTDLAELDSEYSGDA